MANAMSLKSVLLFLFPFCLINDQANAQTTEAVGTMLIVDMNAYVSAAGAVIGDLQPVINSGKATSDQISPDSLKKMFITRYQKNTGKPYDTKTAGIEGEAREAFITSMMEVLGKAQPVLRKGGQDSFVPAYFRAQVLKKFNVAMKGKIQGYATNRDKELINADWGVDSVMKGSPFAPEVKQWMLTGSLDPKEKKADKRLLGYWPMKLGASCVACHARNGLNQKEGEFGGALISEVWIK
jgi:hypothetical protein